MAMMFANEKCRKDLSVQISAQIPDPAKKMSKILNSFIYIIYMVDLRCCKYRFKEAQILKHFNFKT